jgi:glycosyltransferase involved in cell wall biosynthesis
MAQDLLGSGVKVTVGIIVRNEARHIAETVENVLNVDYDPSQFEIIVIDGHSTDDTPAIVQSFIDRRPRCSLRLVPEVGPGEPGIARNMVLDQARGEYVAFTDADCVVARDWLTSLVRVLERARKKDARVIAAGGIRYPIETTNWKERVLNSMLGSYLGSGGSAGFVLRREALVDSIGNYNAIYVRAVAHEQRYAPIRFGEDFEFNRRLVRKGYRIVLSGEPKVYHHQESSFRTFAWQMFQYGAGQARVLKRFGTVRTFAPLMAAFVLGGGFGWLPGLVFAALLWAYLAVLGMYLLLVAATAVKLAIKHRALYPMVALGIFPLQHGAYGLGFLKGLVKPLPPLPLEHLGGVKRLPGGRQPIAGRGGN